MHSRKIIATLILLLYVIPLHSQELTFNLLEDHKENLARFESDAPIETVVGTTNRVFGFVTLDPHNISNGISGKISVDLVSLDTGISMRDRDMRSEPFLNTDEYPTAMFLLKEVLQTENEQITGDEPVKIKVRGDFQVRGVTKTIDVTAQLTLMADNNSSKSKENEGQYFLTGNVGFQIKLGDYGIKRPKFLFLQLAEEVNIEVTFQASVR